MATGHTPSEVDKDGLWPTALTTGKGVTVGSAIAEAGRWLEDFGVIDPEQSASELLAKAWGFRCPMDMLARHPRHQLAGLTAAQWRDFEGLCLRRSRHEPVQYLVGEWDFHGVSLAVRPPTLIPRPETEELVERVLQWLRVEEGVSDEGQGLRILDVGTGTGAIGLALLHELPGATCVALDVSEAAVELATANAARVGVGERYTCVHASIADFARLSRPSVAAAPAAEPGGGTGRESTGQAGSGFDVIVSNPPYIPTADLHGLAADVIEHEDRGALDGGSDGLTVIRDIVAGAHCLLRPGGFRRVWLEVDSSHPAAIGQWLGPGKAGAEAAGVSAFQWMEDLSGLPRFVALTFSAPSDGRAPATTGLPSPGPAPAF